MILKDGRLQNETCDQNDFGRSEVYILNGPKKNDFEKWFSDTYSTSKIISQGWGDVKTMQNSKHMAEIGRNSLKNITTSSSIQCFSKHQKPLIQGPGWRPIHQAFHLGWTVDLYDTNINLKNRKVTSYRVWGPLPGPLTSGIVQIYS